MSKLQGFAYKSAMNPSCNRIRLSISSIEILIVLGFLAPQKVRVVLGLRNHLIQAFFSPSETLKVLGI